MRLIILILSLLLCAQPVKAQETKAGPAAAGVVVVVVGGVVVVVLIRTCRKLFPKTTNAPPELLLAGGGSAAGASFWFDGYCFENDLKALETTAHLVEGVVGQDGDITQFGLIPEKRTQTETEFAAYLASLGLPLDYGTHYARNGRRCEPWEVPIAVEHGEVPQVTVTCNGYESITRVVERSYDLVTWTAVVTNSVPACYRVEFSDQSDGDTGFYRTRRL